MNLNLKTKDGRDVEVTLRKLPLRHLGKLAGELNDEQKACLCMAPEGRNPDEVREFFESLDEDSQFQVWDAGIELNQANLAKFSAKKRKLAEASGIDLDAMIQKAMESKMATLMDGALAKSSPDSSETGTDGGTSKTPTAPTKSST